MQFDDGSHCHWTWRRGAYQTFGFWPTQEMAQEAAVTVTIPDIRDYQEPEVFQVHSPTHCTCDNRQKEETAA
jgi:hypothetical protein